MEKDASTVPLSDTITDNIISNILNDAEATEFLTIVSRNHLKQVIAEQDLNLAGLLDRQTVASLGKVLGVHEIVVGQITQIIYIPPETKRTTLNRKKQSVRKQEQRNTLIRMEMLKPDRSILM